VEGKGAPTKYTLDEKSPLRVEVKKGPNVVNFELTSR
jgi:hypothetical protein